MTDSCDIRDEILADTSSSGLNNLTKQALKLIRTHIFPNAQRVNPSQAVTLTLTYPYQGEYTISPSDLVFELEKIDFDRKLGVDTTRMRGCYRNDEGKMYLNRGNWCIETIIHETLHACSRTSESDKLNKYLPLYEGLTEFYTGFILSREYPQCYQNCFRTDVNRLCQMTYVDTTKLWVAFCNFLPLRDTTGIYFPTNKSWNDEMEDLVKAVKKLGFNKFENPFKSSPASLKFRLLCSKAFGDKFDKICDNRNRYTDFNTIRES